MLELSVRTNPVIPPTPLDELKKIPNADLRKDAIRLRMELDEALAANG